MLTNVWSVSLTVCGFAVLFLVFRASFTAIRVLLSWDAGNDSKKQIDLEAETRLSALLIQSALVVQIISLGLLLQAAESFSGVLAGAMCGTGSFLANAFGFPSLVVKMAGFFLYGFWLLVHRLDMQSEYYPLTRFKHGFILLLLPLIVADVTLQTLYLAGLEPDIITSCCGTVFSQSDGNILILSENYSVSSLLFLFYLAAALLLAANLTLFWRQKKGAIRLLFYLGLGGGWLLFFIFSMVVLIMVISSYIYAMPYHHCPFCMLKGEYLFIGYPIYLTLFGGTFFGVSPALAGLFYKRVGVQSAIEYHQRGALKVSSVCLVLFVLLSSCYPLLYFIFDGQPIFF